METNFKNFALIFETDEYKEKSLQHKKHCLRQLREKSVSQEHKLLGLHGLSYYSPINTNFSFELDDLDLITYFSPVVLRDGVVGLSLFFDKNPQPLKKTLILVQKKLNYLIPKSWEHNCLVYEYQSKIIENTEQPHKLIISTSGFGKKQASQQSIEQLCEEIKKYKCIDEVWITGFPTFPKVSIQKDIELQNEHIESVILLSKKFNQNIKVKTFYQIEKSNLTNSVFWDLNYYQFYYSDSYFINTLLANGSKPASVTSQITENNFEKISEINLSFNHKISIFKSTQNSNFEATYFLNELKKTSLLKNKVKNDNKDFFRPIENIAFKVAQKFYKP